MGTITAKHLKQKTGEVIKRVKAGERLTVTYRGKPVAVISPSTEEENTMLQQLSPFEKAWKDIERCLDNTKPEFESWREATRWFRDRSRF